MDSKNFKKAISSLQAQQYANGRNHQHQHSVSTTYAMQPQKTSTGGTHQHNLQSTTMKSSGSQSSIGANQSTNSQSQPTHKRSKTQLLFYQMPTSQIHQEPCNKHTSSVVIPIHQDNKENVDGAQKRMSNRPQTASGQVANTQTRKSSSSRQR
jgi:uncharacterized membrane protein YcgQ (UPF0703/DUF1980 family)